jgi:hypothetical protein
MGMDSSIKDRPMLMPIREDGEWTAPEWFHSMARGAMVPAQAVLGGTVTPLDTAMATADYTGGGLLSSKAIPNAVPDGSVLGVGVAKKTPPPRNTGHMDEGLRMARANEMGYNRDAYHGSTRDIRKFNTVFGNPEGHYGANHYFTNSVDDLGKNYAGEGPDLTQRIEMKMERLGDEGIEPSRKAAKEALGIENKGVSYPVKLKLKNPVKTHGKDETFFDYQAKYDEDPSSDYYEEFLGEEGKFIDLIDDTKRVMSNWNVDDADGIIGKLQEANVDMDGISASQFENVMRNNIYEAYHPETGEMSSVGELIADVYKIMGYDGVEMDAYKAFGPQKWGGERYMTKGMEGLDQDTLHYIAFEPNQIRSKFAEFDLDKAMSGDILAGVGGATLALPLLSEREGRE